MKLETTSMLREVFRATTASGRFASHCPSWNIEEFQPGRWWILDGETKVGLSERRDDVAELVNFDPLSPHEVEFPETYHAATLPGDRVTMSTWLGDAGTSSDENSISFSVSNDGVTATFEERWNDGATARRILTWKVDADFGYILHCEADLSVLQLREYPYNTLPEYCNFLPRGVTDDRPGAARYPYILWQHTSGKIIRWNQNNIGARALGALDVHERRRLMTGGFIGYFGESDRCSVIEVLDSLPATTTLTCPQMLDEHLLWVPPEVENPSQDESGAYHYRAVYHLVSIPPDVGEELNAQSEMLELLLDRPDVELATRHAWCAHEFPYDVNEAKSLGFCPLETGVVTDFESRLDASVPFRGQVFPYREDVDVPISIVSDCAHSGRHSLCLRPGHPLANGEPLRAWTEHTGVCLHVTEGQKYRLSAWMKTDLDEGHGQLTATECYFTRAHVTAVHESTALHGKTDWQQISVEFTPGEKAHFVDVAVVADGRGTVWADEILLEKIDAT